MTTTQTARPSLALPVLTRLMGTQATFSALLSDPILGQYRWGQLVAPATWGDLGRLTAAGYVVGRSPGGRFVVRKPKVAA